MAFTLFVIPTRDHSNHDNLIYRRRGCSRARYKETMSMAGTNSGIQRGGGRECEKVNSKNRMLHTGKSGRRTNGGMDRQIYIQIVFSRGNGTDPSQWPRSLASCKCVQGWAVPRVSVGPTLHLLDLRIRQQPQPAPPPPTAAEKNAVMEARGKKRTEKQKINFQSKCKSAEMGDEIAV